MSSDRQRNRKNRISKRAILVSYEGKNKTEDIYLGNYNGRDNNYVIRKVPGNDTDPISLVEHTIAKVKELSLDLTGDDRAFCMFDTDVKPEKNSQISEAIRLAKENNIIPIVSAPCVEVWFLLHYRYSTAQYSSNDEVIEELKKHCAGYNKSYDIYPLIFGNTNKAIINAKRLEKFQLENGRILQTVETNPYTEVYKIIEEIQKN